ncbi:polysaccharide lyase family 1 protein [Piromyces sp. E2]|nr:polysaccharide lyase family 1 protein [Piromyces sp. E2]|eukprot:OUM61156.1 polysaccharide lyase family 1 protein [Piromyces sp. E2]
MKFFKINIIVLLTTTVVNATLPIGFGQNTTGGEGGIVYHINTLTELKNALLNNGNSTDPKIIYIDSPINGYVLEDGSLINDEVLAPGYTFQKYLDCFSEDGLEAINTSECQNLLKVRKQGMGKYQNQVKIKVTPNTTIIGNGNKSKLEEISIQVSNVNNVIIKNLSIKAPNDLYPEFKPKNGWSSSCDAINISGSTNVWVDNCYLSDGDKNVDDEPIYYENHVERHDGLIDVVNGSDFVTISNNRFENHVKTILIGSSDSKTTDRDHLRVSLYNNVFINCQQRIPRVRFGKVHIFNNYYISTDYKNYPITYDNEGNIEYKYICMGLGLECNILSEYNSFNFPKNKKFGYTNAVILENYGGYIFNDNGSKYNGYNIDLNALAKKTFESNVASTKANNLVNGNENPIWVNANFTTETFNPSEYYSYDTMKNIEKVNELLNYIPSWMFNEVEDSDNFDESEYIDEITTEIFEESSDLN